MSKSKKIIKASVFIAAAIGGALLVVLMAAFPEAKAAIKVAHQVESDLIPYLQTKNTVLEIDVTQSNLLNLFTDELDYLIDESSKYSSKAINKSNSAEINDAGGRKCKIQISAQSSNEDLFTGDLAHLLGDTDLFWSALMTHEIAHCIRNPYRQSTQEMDSGQFVKFTPALIHLNESYADGFSVAYHWNESPAKSALLSQKLQKWRSGMSVAVPWRTSPTLIKLSQLLSELEPGTKLSIAQIDELSWNSSINAIQTHVGRGSIALSTADSNAFLSWLKNQH